ncbi:hypothetical protein CAMGR0001_1302 [Campylobacter gracilis RM3268]|uniref:Uncharacterized protein n=1 Tax=Campylobacter gracilis RM3268 TaxID=553220 RepID=C8PJA3_9BACT|nr:hypothetical protein CAMGR0001_1302 [Campylobacter gracilis RM3268]
MKVRLNLIDTGTAANLHSKWLNCRHERGRAKRLANGGVYFKKRVSGKGACATVPD